MENLSELRTRLTERREARRQAAAETVLAGGGEELADAELEQALDDAESLVLRRAREEQAERQAALVAERRAALQKAHQKRLDCLAKAEAACSTLVAELADAAASADQIALLARHLGHALPLPLSGREPELRIATHIAGALSSVTSTPRRGMGGVLNWSLPALPSSEPWRDAEARTTDRHIAALLKEPTNV